MTPLTNILLVGLAFCGLGICLLPLIIPSNPTERRSMGVRLHGDDE